MTSILGSVAASRGTITYSSLVHRLQAVRLGPDDPRLNAMLAEVSTEQDCVGKGMLSVLVIHKTGDMEPGEGFFKLAAALGKNIADRQQFWISELNRVHAAWARPKSPAAPGRAGRPPADDGASRSADSSVNQEQRAAAVWAALAACAKMAQTITYKELGRASGGFHHRVLRFPLVLIQDYCITEKLAPLTSLVVRVGDARPGKGFTAWDADDLETAQQRVFAFDWDGLPNPFGYAVQGSTEEELADRLVEMPNSSAEVYQLVKVRGKAQAIFRQALLRAYDSSCAFCELSFTVALDAAHIVPWAACSADERMSVNNGILLCSNHHGLFDADWLRVDEAYRIQYSGMARKHGSHSPMDEAVSANLHGRTMTLPKDKKLWPAPEHIRTRFGGRGHA